MSGDVALVCKYAFVSEYSNVLVLDQLRQDTRWAQRRLTAERKFDTEAAGQTLSR